MNNNNEIIEKYIDDIAANMYYMRNELTQQIDALLKEYNAQIALKLVELKKIKIMIEMQEKLKEKLNSKD